MIHRCQNPWCAEAWVSPPVCGVAVAVGQTSGALTDRLCVGGGHDLVNTNLSDPWCLTLRVAVGQTSGLDSVTALSLLEKLREIADAGRTTGASPGCHRPHRQHHHCHQCQHRYRGYHLSRVTDLKLGMSGGGDVERPPRFGSSVRQLKPTNVFDSHSRRSSQQQHGLRGGGGQAKCPCEFEPQSGVR
jgi:hypothetical protein